MERQDEMELRFDEKYEKDPLLKLNAIVRRCIEQIGCLGAICWDNPPEGVSHELYQLAGGLDSLPTLAQHGWALVPELDQDLTCAADGVVSLCGVVAQNAHTAALLLADRICCDMFSRSAVIQLTPPGTIRRGYIDPKNANFRGKDVERLRDRLERLHEDPESVSREYEAVFREYEGLWKRVHPPVSDQEIEVLGAMVQREYVITRDHRAKQMVVRSAKAEAPEKRPWTQSELDDAIKVEIAKYVEAIQAARHGKRGAREAIRKALGRNALARRFGVKSAKMVGNCADWQHLADEFGMGRKSGPSRPKKIGLAFAEEAAAEAAGDTTAADVERRETFALLDAAIADASNAKTKRSEIRQALVKTKESLMRGEMDDAKARGIAEYTRRQLQEDKARKVSGNL
jgi:hypothetical protein